jgi:hypothetical protein
MPSIPTDDTDRSAQLDRIKLMLQGLVAHKDELRRLASLAAEHGIRKARSTPKARRRRKLRKKR